jgi:arylsulfatase A-like enzyme
MLGDYRDIVGHMLSLHDNLLHVPLIIHHPKYPKGLSVSNVVQTLDIYPSVLEWAGINPEIVPSAQTQRPSLTESLLSNNHRDNVAFAEEDYTGSYDVLEGLRRVNPAMELKKYPQQQISIRSATHKFVWCNDRPGEFYNLVKDPGELTNLINRPPPSERDVLLSLNHKIERWRSELELFPPRMHDVNMAADPKISERLRDLGYLE